MAFSKNQSSLKNRIYKIVKEIPMGKVATYGEIAEKLRVESEDWKVDSRIVGWMLHQKRDSRVPCHRVVDRNGRLAPNFAFSAKGGSAPGWDGWREQRRRLEVEGVKFTDEMHVDLATCLWHV